MLTLENILEGKKLLIFDFDGTLVDSSRYHFLAFQDALRKYSLSFSYDSIAGKSTRDSIIDIFEENKVDYKSEELQDLVLMKQQIFRSKYLTMVTLLPGIKEFIKWSYSRFTLSLATSGSKETVSQILINNDIIKFFDSLVYSEDVSSGKPNPEIFELVVKKYNFLREEILIFEDSTAGFQAATSAGIDFYDANTNLYDSIK